MRKSSVTSCMSERSSRDSVPERESPTIVCRAISSQSRTKKPILSNTRASGPPLRVNGSAALLTRNNTASKAARVPSVRSYTSPPCGTFSRFT
jgi:hypothetical protein